MHKETTVEERMKSYKTVLAILFIATIIEYLVGTFIHSNVWIKFLPLLAIALFKGGNVIAYFMHVRYEEKPLLLITMVFIVPLAITLPIALFPIFA